MYKVSGEMPKEGKFIAIWNNENGVWSDTLQWFENELFVYVREDDWEPNGVFPYEDIKGIAYITLEEE